MVVTWADWIMGFSLGDGRSWPRGKASRPVLAEGLRQDVCSPQRLSVQQQLPPGVRSADLRQGSTVVLGQMQGEHLAGALLATDPHHQVGQSPPRRLRVLPERQGDRQPTRCPAGATHVEPARPHRWEGAGEGDGPVEGWDRPRHDPDRGTRNRSRTTLAGTAMSPRPADAPRRAASSRGSAGRNGSDREQMHGRQAAAASQSYKRCLWARVGCWAASGWQTVAGRNPQTTSHGRVRSRRRPGSACLGRARPRQVALQGSPRSGSGGPGYRSSAGVHGLPR